MKFENTKVNKELFFSLGSELESGDYFISFPVTNRSVVYKEHYRITEEQYEHFIKDDAAANKFADRCRKHKHDE